MSEPTEIDFAIVKMGDGGGTEAFTTICGLSNVVINRGAQSSDRYVRDCAKPGAVPVRKQRITGKSIEVTGSGLTNADEIERMEDALGTLKNYHVELYKDDGTDAGDLLGTYAFASHMTTANMNLTREGDAQADITLPSHGTWTYTPAA
jgi:hypothetical protein